MSWKEVTEEATNAEYQPAPESVEFVVPVPKYTVVILICLAVVFAVQLWVSRPIPTSPIELLFFEPVRSINDAAFVKPAFLNGEYWRILTGSLMHGFLVHILMNSYAFYSFGKLFELLTNRAHLPIVFLLSAIGGGLLSTYFMPEGISVGASGGIVGLIGYLLIYAFRRRQFISSEFRKSLLVNIGFILIFGFMLFGIVDNWGHIGGLLGGAVYGFVQIPADAYKNPQLARPFTEALGLAALGICMAGSLFTIYLMLLA